MATKKKELLEQENSAPETTVPVENTPPPDEAQADMAAPADGGDLNELLASMDQPDEDAAPIEDGSSLPELTESEMFGEEAADTAEDVDTDALPGEDDTSALTEGPDSDDADDARMPLLFPLMMGRPMSPVSLFLKRLRNRNRPSPSGPPAGKRPRRPRVQSRWKKFTAEAEPPEPMAPAGEDAPSDDGEAAAAEDPASLAEPPAEAAPAPASHSQAHRRSPPQRALHPDHPQPGRCGDAGRP